MHIYTLRRETLVGTDTDTVWSFLSNPKNLNALTPPNLRFKIVSETPDLIFDGLLIEYRIRIPWFGMWSWLTEIKHVRERRSFVDEQRIGPYSLWYHYHGIGETENGTLIVDDIHYAMPFGLLGELVHSLYVVEILQKVFDYREAKLKELLGKPNVR